MTTRATIPVIDVSSLTTGEGDTREAAAGIGTACREHGFFYITGHGVDLALQDRLEKLGREFFMLDSETKNGIRMELAGRAWRGFFPVGAEYTSGKPDQKEGIYFGQELPANHPKVLAGVPLHGANLFPDIAGFKETILEYLDKMIELGHALMKGIALSLGLEGSYFRERYTADPLILFRIFYYPPLAPTEADALEEAQNEWSVGEHTDYGILTILRQDTVGGLQVKSRSGWIEAPPISNSFICNIGDMLDRMTGGIYKSTPHRVLNRSGIARMSFPFFFDPNFDAEVKPIDPESIVIEDKFERWDRASVHEFSGTYGDYILNKVSKVFPELSREAL